MKFHVGGTLHIPCVDSSPETEFSVTPGKVVKMFDTEGSRKRLLQIIRDNPQAMKRLLR